MRRVLYVSDSRIGSDQRALDHLMVQSQRNNGLDAVTGLLWTDGRRFSQVLEGEDGAVEATLERICSDSRHANLRIVEDSQVNERQFGDWAMLRPEAPTIAAALESKMLAHLRAMETGLAAVFADIIGHASQAAG